MKKIIVLGGGAAGWLSALFVKKIFPNIEVKLIESEKIGILGAGEGSTPHLVNFLKFLNIDIFNLIKETKGTIKHGINFENWNGDNKKYFHGFISLNELNNFKIKNSFTHDCFDKYLLDCVSKGYDLNQYLYGSLLVDNKKVDTINEGFSLHFDAHKIANYLKKVAKKRGIIHYVGEFEFFDQDQNGNIIQVNLEDKSNHSCDFIFDCTGFNRLIIGKTFNSRWIDYQEYLPMKKAVPFFLDQDEEIQPCTHAVAMKYGWMWKIPLQHRFGAGYIYDSDYINEDEALLEAENLLQRKLESPRVISFNAGRYEKVWIKNCIAVGLSAGFTEPLEATSLFITSQQLLFLLHFKENLFDASDSLKESFNLTMGNSNDDILGFLYLHYLTKRNDSSFWINFKSNTKVPEKLKEKLFHLKEKNLIYTNFEPEKSFASFSFLNYLVVSYGLNLLNNNNIKSIEGLEPTTSKYKSFMLSKLNTQLYHRQFLENVSNNN